MEDYQKQLDESIKINWKRQELCLKVSEILYQATKQQWTVEETKAILVLLLFAPRPSDELKVRQRIYKDAPDLSQ